MSNSGRPSNAGFPPPVGITGSGVYVKPANVYNFPYNGLRKTRSAIARAAAGSGYARIVTVGDSITAGKGATNRYTGSWPVVMQSVLTSHGATIGGNGWCFPWCNLTNTSDSRWTYTNYDKYASDDGSTMNFAVSTTLNATLGFASDQVGTIVEIAYLGNSGNFTYSIDGGAAVPVVPPATQTIQKITVSGLANTTHTVLVTSSTAAFTGISAIQVRNATSGLLISNPAVAASKTTPWTLGGALPWYESGKFARLVEPNPDLVIIEAMIVNDAQTGGSGLVPVATTQSNLTDIITQFKALASAPDILMIIPPTPNPANITTATWAPYMQAVYAVSDAMGVPVIDIADRWGSYATANGLGLMFDTFHPSDAGYQDMGRAIASLVVAV